MARERTRPLLALDAALLFGLSAPAAKLLIAVTDPWLLAGLLYLGSGTGLGFYRLAGGGGARPIVEQVSGLPVAGVLLVQEGP
jgi:hypothetical protein